MAKLTAKTRNALPKKSFANPKDRKFPLQDKAHIRSARSYIRFASPAEKTKINAAAKRAGIGQK
jgi:hypothetical protein